MKKGLLPILLLTLIAAGQAGAQTFQFNLQAGGNAVSGGLDVHFPMTQGMFVTGIDGVFQDGSDRYQIAGLKLGVGSETLYPGLSMEVGFKGLWGAVEDENHDEATLGGVGFFLSAAYRTAPIAYFLPLSVFTHIYGVPNPMAFSDLDQYVQASAGVGLHLVESAALVVAYRHLEAQVTDGDDDWEISDNDVYFGLQLTF